ncbi:MAG: prepilin-type N-terminal cleavage/methylation domain-containing protein [Planctomycetota bacterium]
MFIFKRGEEMKAQKGFTLVEILIVVVIYWQLLLFLSLQMPVQKPRYRACAVTFR